eukprot:TRINITY_DN599_c0_g1_i2.p1 TRINITY_DN599_c0_g1~~TRINITY_DN599_c0_g1_i2.p1  ORF type:complete len:105 (-),score=18.25 TRINITY_DN599_c0_g1_i2:345-659(-)
MLRTVLKFNRQIFFKPRLQVDKVHIRNFVFYNHKKMSRNWQEETKDKLTDFEKYVLWEKGTERSGTGEYDNFYPKKGGDDDEETLRLITTTTIITPTTTLTTVI